MNIARLLWFSFFPPFCHISVLFFLIVSSLYFSFVFVESYCYICIVSLCFVKGGVDSPSSKWGRHGKLEENWKRQFSPSGKSTEIYAGIKVASSKGSISFERELSKGQKVVICLFYWQDLGSWLPRGVGRKEILPFYFHMLEICVSWQTPSLMPSVAGCRYSGRIELN